MASMTIKNIPDDLLVRLRGLAATENRSLNRQVIHLLERSLSEERRDAQARRVRSQVDAWEALAGRWESERSAEEIAAEIRDARTSGRDVDL